MISIFILLDFVGLRNAREMQRERERMTRV
jgi:hypothetical protein